MKIGVVNGGGDCPGLNAVIRAITNSAISKYGYQVVGIPDAFSGIIVDNHSISPLTINNTKDILPQGGTILGTRNNADPFKYPENCHNHICDYVDKSDILLKRIKNYGIDALVMIGGDGTMRLANKLAKLGLNIVGVPKTIDNDLAGTDQTFGHDSACNIAMESIDRLRTTAYSHHRIMICEVMGRNAGWLALQSGISGGADIILIPEIPYHIESIMTKLESNQRLGYEFSIIVVAEGVAKSNGELNTIGESFSGSRLGGAAEYLTSLIAKHTEQEVRHMVLGHLQRGGSPTHFDRVLGTRYGVYATDMISKGLFSHMASLQNGCIKHVDFEVATKEIKLVNPKSNQLIEMARNIGISFGD